MKLVVGKPQVDAAENHLCQGQLLWPGQTIAISHPSLDETDLSKNRLKISETASPIERARLP